jgi:FkbM family methyltransferase
MRLLYGCASGTDIRLPANTKTSLRIFNLAAGPARSIMKRLLRASVNFLPHGLRTWIKYLPGIAALQRGLVSRLISGEPFLHTVNAGPAKGLRFEVTLPLDKAIWAGTYESEFAEAIARGLKPGNVCYDIGGYRGYMAGVMALAGASKVFVFEPLPMNQKALRRLCELNPKLPIELLPVAIGKADGLTMLKVMADPSMGKLASSSFQPESAFQDELEIGIRSIDTQVEEGKIPPPDLVKVDVEGAELDVLRGATRVLTVSRPSLFLEAHSASLERSCSQMLQNLGYKVHRLGSEPSRDEHARHLVCLPA